MCHSLTKPRCQSSDGAHLSSCDALPSHEACATVGHMRLSTSQLACMQLVGKCWANQPPKLYRRLSSLAGWFPATAGPTATTERHSPGAATSTVQEKCKCPPNMMMSFWKPGVPCLNCYAVRSKPSCVCPQSRACMASACSQLVLAGRTSQACRTCLPFIPVDL